MVKLLLDRGAKIDAKTRVSLNVNAVTTSRYIKEGQCKYVRTPT